MMYTKIVHGKKSSYTVRNVYEMSTFSMNSFVIDVNPLLRFKKSVGPITLGEDRIYVHRRGSTSCSRQHFM